MIDAIQNLVRFTDSVIARAYLSIFRERNALLCFLFHSLFRDEREMARNMVDPLERTTLAKFRQLIEYYLEHGYQFICPGDLLKGLEPNGKYALITFDDGYHNNVLSLPILEEFKVPATFFISTNNVLQNKCYWWDVMYRERLARGGTPRQVYHEIIAMKSMTTEQIQEQLIARFGQNCIVPRSDIDRPFSPDELREFSRHPLVHLGNHSANHAILTNYDDRAMIEQIKGAQESLLAMTGILPNTIAYPNGAYSPAVLQACGKLGLKVGFTVRPAKNIVPLGKEPNDLLRLNRFCPTGHGEMANQCRTYRSDFLLYGMLRGGYLRLARGQAAQ